MWGGWEPSKMLFPNLQPPQAGRDEASACFCHCPCSRIAVPGAHIWDHSCALWQDGSPGPLSVLQ